MKLRRLELIGFKSFMNKTILNFEDGITGVVGPNGCGKSNIVDAIFWVMGDQSPKHLRGSEMEDVIFAGSDKYPAAGMAQINLTFSTEDGIVPVNFNQFSEITITRRLYRSGESEYLINKTPCRLKDILELFMDTGVGAKSYAIIEQGHIEKIVGQKAPERRVFIEEAAGITKFKSRKREAQFKIESTEQNLLRVTDILSEIKKQCDSLSRQAAKAQRYKELKEKIRDIELTVMSQEFQALTTRLVDVDTQKKQKSQHGELVEVEIQKAESLVEKLKVKLIETERMLHQAQQDLYQTQQTIQSLENQREIKSKEIENWKSLSAKDETDIRSLKVKKESVVKSQKSILEELSRLQEEKGIHLQNLQQEENILKREQVKSEMLNQKIDQQKTELMDVIAEMATSGGFLKNLEEKKEAFSEEKINLQEEIYAADKKIKDHEKKKKELEFAIGNSKIEKKNLVEDRQTQETRLTNIKSEIQEKQKMHEEIKDQCRHIESRLQTLREITQNFEGYEAGAKYLLTDAPKKDIKIQGVIAEIIETEAKYEAAIEAVLREKMQYLIVQNKMEAMNALRLLKEKKVGQAHVIPLDAFVLYTSPSLSSQPLDSLFHKVRTKKEFEPILKMFLHNVYYVENLEAAICYWEEHPGHYTLVTKVGEIIDSQGVLYGGVFDSTQQHTGFLSRKREMKELGKKFEEEKEKLQLTEQKIVELLAAQETLAAAIITHQNHIHQKEVLEVTLQKDISQIDEILEQSIHDRQEKNDALQSHAEQEKEVLGNLSKEKHRKVNLEEKKKVLEETAITFKNTEQRVRMAIEEKQGKITEIKISQTAVIEKEGALKRQNEHFDLSLKNIIQEIEEKSEAVNLATERQKTIQEEIFQSNERLSTLIQKLEETRAQSSELQVSFDQEMQRCKVLEEGIKKQRGILQKNSQEMHDLELQIAQANMTLQHLADQVRERYIVELSSIYSQYLNKELKETDKTLLISLKEKANQMGEVNLVALEEYEEFKQRFSDLEKQKEDLLKSIDSLKKTIDKINKICRERFKETFEVVNVNFKRIFPMLFGGGKAELILTDENDLLETGIEIIAKPPGKKHQNINLLSGGEKALTAVSLMFGVFLMKPSPFCVLDEVDAPLDDANVGRFNEMVRQMTSKSQFVIITHNKKTMSMADILYGVTMELPGISTMVSVKLDRAVQIAEKDVLTQSTNRPIEVTV